MFMCCENLPCQEQCPNIDGIAEKLTNRLYEQAQAQFFAAIKERLIFPLCFFGCMSGKCHSLSF